MNFSFGLKQKRLGRPQGPSRKRPQPVRFVSYAQPPQGSVVTYHIMLRSSIECFDSGYHISHWRGADKGLDEKKKNRWKPHQKST